MHQTMSKPPEASSQKGILFNLSVFQFLTYLRRGVFYTFMINYLFLLMQTVTSTAALGTLNMIASSLGQNLLWGKISDRYKIRAKLIIAGETVAACSYILVFLLHRNLIEAGSNFAAGISIVTGLSIMEFFWSMSDIGWATLLTDITTPQKRGRIIGALNFVASVGRMVGILFAGTLYDEGNGFKSGTIFYIVTALLLIGAALMTLTSRSIKTKKLTQEYIGTANPEPAETVESGNEGEKTYKWFLVSLIIIVLGAGSINQIFLLFIDLPTGLNASEAEVSLILTAWTIGGMIASLTSGPLSDRIGRSKVLLLGLALAMLTPPLYGVASNVTTMALTYGLNGMSFWTIQTVGFVLAGDLIPKDKRGRLLSRYNTVMALSWGPAGILIGGPIADIQTQALQLPAYDAYVNAFYASASILIIGTTLFTAKIAALKQKDTGLN